MNLKKYFHSDFDHPPLIYKVFTYFVFGYLVLSQAVIQGVRRIVVKPSKRLIRDSKKLMTFSREIYPEYDDSMELAGNRHEIDKSYVPTTNNFYYIYNVGAMARMKSCFHREIQSCPGHIVRVSDGVKLNFCSYNYLGFAQDSFREQLLGAVRKYGFGQRPRSEVRAPLLDELEARVAYYVGKPAAVVHCMGFDTNALAIPVICAPGSLIISDSLNHCSIVQGCKHAKCTVRVFKHTMEDLKRVLAEVEFGQFREVWLFVEGLYSMEGCYLQLAEVMELKRRYSFKLYIDEAHSIGSVGPRGRGVCDRYGVNPADVEVLMGTFTKSFSAVGGYIAGSQELVARIKAYSSIYTELQPMQPICAYQILCCLDYMDTAYGIEKLHALHENARTLRQALKSLGFTVYGDDDSPVIPVLFYCPTKMKFIQDYLLRRNIAVVQVGFPAVPIVSGRIRFCISAAHTKDEIDYLIKCMDELGDLIRLKFDK